jgi:hypothetical protein
MKMKTTGMVFLIVALMCAAALGQQTTMREVKGQGVDRQDAIRNALFEAVSQARGVRVDSGDYSFGYKGASAGYDREGPRRTVDFDAVSVQTGGTVFTTEIDGLVKTYEVADEGELDSGLYEVSLRVWVYDHVPVDLTSRRRLAVMPVRTLQQSYTIGELAIPADELSRNFTHRLNAGFTQTNKFAVLDREYIEEFLQERSVLLNDASLEEQSKLGEVLGTDYMLTGTIADARLEIKQLDSPVVGTPLRKYEADFVFDYRVLVASSRQVRVSDSVAIRMENEQIKRLVEDWEPGNLDYRELVNNFIMMAARDVVQSVIHRLYPIRIAAVEGERVIINQGGQHITDGTVLEVVSEGREVIDPDTGESLGLTERVIATLAVERVAANISYASVRRGDVNMLGEGMVCRVMGSQPRERERGRESQVERTHEGGVRMPFDR